MTTPPDDGPDPDAHGTRRALESYPEFFTYPARPDDARPHIPAARAEAPPDPADRIPDVIPDRMPSREQVTGPSADEPAAAPAVALPAEPAAAPPAAPANPTPDLAQRPRAKAQRSAFEPGNRTPPRAAPAPQPWPEPAPFAEPQAQRGVQPPRPAPLTQPWPENPRPAAQQSVQPWPESASGFAENPRPAAAPLNAAEPRSRRAAPASPASPAAAHTSPAAATTPGRGRRRAKRSLAASLWPFHAMHRPVAAPSKRIRSRSTAATVWRKLKADRLALAGGYTIVALILLAVFAPAVSALFGVDPTTPHYDLTDTTFGPHGRFGGMSWAHPLGVDQALGRDLLSRLLYGARVSLLVAFASTVLSVVLGSTLGLVAGYLGGRVDAVITRLMDLFLAFPLLLFALGLTGALTDRAFGLSGNALRIAVMIFVMGFFNWPYIARIVRAEVLSLREREFVDAARLLGAGPGWVIGRELLPNLLSPILVYATLIIPTNIIFEAGLSALGVGLNPPQASWGQMLLDASGTVNTDPAYLIVPGMAVFITVLAFNLFGDGLRDALDPTTQ